MARKVCTAGATKKKEKDDRTTMKGAMHCVTEKERRVRCHWTQINVESGGKGGRAMAQERLDCGSAKRINGFDAVPFVSSA